MKREYRSSIISDNADLFMGKEVEKTSTYGRQTLFVVGCDINPQSIIDKAGTEKCSVIYLGANKSFKTNDIDWDWVLEVIKLSETGYLSPSEYHVYHHRKRFEIVIDLPFERWNDWLNFKNEYGKIDQDTFKDPFSHVHINLSVELPYIDMAGNLNIKIDDIDYDATNRGVWIYKLDHKDFTGWDEYKEDVLL